MHEYMVVALGVGPSKTKEKDLTDRVNAVAAHGWRLIAVAPDPDTVTRGSLAYFEREKP